MQIIGSNRSGKVKSEFAHLTNSDYHVYSRSKIVKPQTIEVAEWQEVI